MDIDDMIEQKLVHEIHTSERRSYRACRRRWDWLFRQNYYPIVTAKPLEFGVAYHAAMEVFYRPETWDWDPEIRAEGAKIRFVEECSKQKAKAIAAQATPYLDDEVEQDYNERVELGAGMLDYYFKQVSPKLDRGWRPVKVEVAFMVAIPHPHDSSKYIYCKCDQCENKFLKWGKGYDNHNKILPEFLCNGVWIGLPVVYAGRLDMLAQDEKGDYWIFDWKTARSIAERYDFLYLDDQVGSYPWALQRLGIPVRGFVYHEQRKGYPQPPEKNKVRRLGRLFSVNKNQDTSYEMYLDTIMVEDAQAYQKGLYDDFLSYLRADGIVYYDRHQIHKTQAELEETEQNIGLEALEMTDPNLSIYPSAGRFGCGFCAFQQPCLEKNNKGDYQYALDTLFEKREHYYVRESPSTESKGGE